MNNITKKELSVFIPALAIIVATFAGGIIYLNNHRENLLASAANTTAQKALFDVVPSAPTSTDSNLFASTSVPMATTTKATKPGTITAKKKVAAKPPAPAPAPAPTPAPAPAPAPAPTPAPTPAPAPAPVQPTIKTLPYTITSFSENQGWENWWGNFQIATDSITFGSDKDNGGGGVLLHGTNDWTNYTFAATLDWVKGRQLGLMARYTDNDNYVLCNFDEEFLGSIHVTVEQRLHGETVILASGDILSYDQVGGSNVTAYIRVQDTYADCSFQNHTISSFNNGTTINPPFNGRIGFTAWDPNPNNSQIIVKSISVKANY